jgi:hypothetical protein
MSDNMPNDELEKEIGKDDQKPVLLALPEEEVLCKCS